MSLSRELATAVDALARASTPTPCAAIAEGDGNRLVLHLTAAGPVGLAFDALEFTAADRSPRPPEALRAWADRLAARLTYLMEPLAPLELDREAGEVLIRSRAPSHRDDLRTYYELRLRADGTLRLARFAFDGGASARRPAPCQMTLEALERLADDLVVSASAG